MYEQVEKPKENKSRAVANSVAQEKKKGKQGVGFVDNRSETILQRELIESMNVNNCIQAMMWTRIGGVWYADDETTNPTPTHEAENGTRYDDGLDVVVESESEEEEETIDDLKRECGNSPVSIGNYNKGARYLRGVCGAWKGEDTHSSSSMHKHPKSRLQEMYDAGATITQLNTVMGLWGR